MRSSSRAAFRTSYLALLLATSGAAGSACSEAPAAGDCAKLFSHLVDLEAAKSQGTDEEKAERKTTMENENRAEFVERCETNIKASQVTCSLKATTLKEIEACDNKG